VSQEPLERVGFVGLGDIGEPMARNLCGAFPQVLVHDLRPEAVEALVASGATAARSPRELGARCQVIGVCVVDDAGTEAVVAGTEGILSGAAPGTAIAIHGTIHPQTAQRLAARAAERGVQVVDAQVTGGRPGAEAKRLRYMVGGDDAALARCRPVFETSAAEITHCGGVGMGAVAKLCNNLVQYQAWQAYTEAGRLAEATGLAGEKLLEVLAWILNDNARAFLAGRNAFAADPDNAFLRGRFSSAHQLAQKDLGLALDVAKAAGVSLPGTALCAARSGALFALAEDEES
jgi:3-hydroxyisobutyrate dehydrogenase-like beta-hydroxyacid dehydrogenase